MAPELIEREAPIGLPVLSEVNKELDGEAWASLSTVFVALTEGALGHVGMRGDAGRGFGAWVAEKGLWIKWGEDQLNKEKGQSSSNRKGK